MPIRLSSIDFWGDQEARIHALIKEALSLLTQERPLPPNENWLNRRVAILLDRVQHAAIRRGEPVPVCAVTFDARHHPDPLEAEERPYEVTRPDLRWDLPDDQAPTIEVWRRTYAVECKRIGNALPNGRNLNKQYVSDGVWRFTDVEHGPYGRNERSAAMIGYLESSSHAQVLSEVNGHAIAASFASLTPDQPWPQSPLCSLRQSVARSSKPTPVALTTSVRL